MMKQKLMLIIVFVSTAFLIIIPSVAENNEWLQTVLISNLNDQAGRNKAQKLLESFSSEEQINVFFQHVDQINSFLSPHELTNGFEEMEILKTKYDRYDIQARWENVYPCFLGYNCRITAFSLFENLIDMKNIPIQDNPMYIMMDLSALEEDPSAFATEEALKKFLTFYEGIQTENTKDINIHLKSIKKAWNDRGITFQESNASLISIFFHDQLDGDFLFIGHTGILIESEEGLYFLEKLSFQEPYQLVRFDNRADLSDYLMSKYDVEFHQPTARPIILENSNLIEGYRIRSDI